MTFPVRVDDTIEDKARITKIEHFKVFFVNESTGHLEYVEIVEEPGKITADTLRPATSGKGGVAQQDATHYDVERVTVDKAIGNLNETLQQARAIPNFENGMPDGYKLLQIVPGSIYDQLGLKNGDVVDLLNGEPINDPGKAFQMFSELKTTSHLEIGVKRNGVKQVINYDIR
jgi:general secretion pathway protein C